MTYGTYKGALSSSADGQIMQSAIIGLNRLPPCMIAAGTVPQVYIGGQLATVTYAGWVMDSVAGLYQVNAQLPSTVAAAPNAFLTGAPAPTVFTQASGPNLASITAPVQLPVVVKTPNGGSPVYSQNNVTIWVAPRLKVSATNLQLLPNANTLPVAGTWAKSIFSATDNGSAGNDAVTWTISSGLLPAGLIWNPAESGTNASISGSPAAYTAGTYTVTVTATDNAGPDPVTGSLTFTIVVQSALAVTVTPSSPFAITTGTTGTVTTIYATGGSYPYTFAVTGSPALPSGIKLDPSTGVISVVGTLGSANTDGITITATDSNGLTGTITINIDIT